ncbi:MAG: methyl-accepting chemotaxis protein [Lachnospiraceae bacterium]|jgi:methyl-accepting chemotaxis protein|nr:methyl-accepting chemotaxis protein [Lachnospiraceae bacterium]
MFKKSLRLRLTVVVTLMTLILLVINAAVSSKNAKDKFISLSDEKYVMTVKYYTEQMENWFLTNEDALDSIVTYAKNFEGKPASMKEFFKEYADSHPSINEIYYGKDDNSAIFSSFKAPDDYVVTERDWYQEAKKTSGIYYTEPYIDMITGDLCISACIATDKGVVGIDLNLNELTKNIPESSDGYIMIATAKGSIVSHPNSEFALQGETVYNVFDVIDGQYKNAMETDDEFKDYDGTVSYITAEEVPCNGWLVALVTPKSTYYAPINSMINIFVLLTIIFCIVAVVVVSILSMRITQPIMKITGMLSQIVRDIQNSEGDLSARIDIDSEDEVGQIADGVNGLMEELDNLIPKFKDAASTVTGHSEGLVGVTDELSEAMNGISSTMEDIANGVTLQAQDVVSATENVDNIGRVIDTVVETTKQLNVIAKDMQTSSIESEDQIKNLQASTETMVNGINRISDQIKETSNAVDVINAKVAAITEIASQTNLLSLNASIEAARAGEMGRGFAVVAEEIGKLAVNSAETAAGIKDEMNNLLATSQSTVAESEQVKELTIKQQEVLEETTNTLEALLKRINETIGHVAVIEDDVKQCVEAQTVIGCAMESLSAISEENAAASEETSATTIRITSSIDELTSSAKELNDVATELTDRLSIFK